MNRIRTRLVLAFLVATILPLLATIWIMTSLLEHSLTFATTEQLDRLSKSLEETGRQYYQQARVALRQDVESGKLSPRIFSKKDEAGWPAEIVQFWKSGETERFSIAGHGGDRIDYLVRQPAAVRVYSRDLGEVHLEELSNSYRDARQLVQVAAQRDLRRGLTTTLIVLVIAVWLVSFASLIYLANRISRPMQQLTEGLRDLAAGRLDTRITAEGEDEIGRAIAAFNRSAAELQQSRDRLAYLTQIASWQTLARKMAHELKNSLTPILYYRLSVVPIRLSSLRDRREEIRALAEYSLSDFCARNNFKPKRFDDGVFAEFSEYDWPGNVRELRNTVERMAILTPADVLTVESIPLEIRLKPDSKPRSVLQETREGAERERILHALEQTDWNVAAAARALNVERTNLHKRMRALGLSRDKS